LQDDSNSGTFLSNVSVVILARPYHWRHVYVWGQALAHNGFAPSWVNREVSVALAALTVLPVYQLDGYAFIPEGGASSKPGEQMAAEDRTEVLQLRRLGEDNGRERV
jgi:hypothetical protein